MVWKILIFVLILAFSPSHEQRSLYLRKARTGKTVYSINQSKIQPINIVDLFSNTLNIFTNVPIALTRTLSGGHGINGGFFPFNSNNLPALGDDFFAEYNYGLRNEDCNLKADQLIAKYGYPVETHKIVTRDGYILTMFRIPSDGPVVLMQHGLIGSADDYLISGPESALPYLLAQNGYDVWLSNSRGNKYSRRHIKLKPSQGAFWDYSWHEIGCYDLPAMIDYVLNITGKDKLRFIGYSRGTTDFFVMGSERPEYMDKIALMIALAPTAFNSHMTSPLVRLLAPSGGFLYVVTRYIGIHEVASANDFMSFIRWIACGTGPIAELFCSNLLFLVAGFNPEQMNVTNLPVVFSHVPSGGSGKEFIHYAQGIISEKFRMFDYGAVENEIRYGSIEPPDYDLEKVTAPVSLVHSEKDWLVHPIDVEKLKKLLPNVVESHIVQNKNFNHLDFILARDVKKLVYERVIKVLSRY